MLTTLFLDLSPSQFHTKFSHLEIKRKRPISRVIPPYANFEKFNEVYDLSLFVILAVFQSYIR
jgi:hypothetical protein